MADELYSRVSKSICYSTSHYNIPDNQEMSVGNSIKQQIFYFSLFKFLLLNT